jgi:hypothetical protein
MRLGGRTGIPLADARSFAAAARRTAITQAATLALLLGLLALGALLARAPVEHHPKFLPRASSGIVVLDLSASISSDTFDRIQTTLSDLAASKGRYGLIVFSDVAYEAFPPGTPASELKPLVRYFIPRSAGPGQPPTYPTNPWTNDFSSGTKISAGLALARAVISRDRLRNPSVLLVSDLSDDTGDLAPLGREMVSYVQNRIPLRVVGLNPQPQDRQFFASLLGSSSSIRDSRLPGQPAPAQQSLRAGFPVALALTVLALVGVLGTVLVWSARLEPAGSSA